MKKMRKNNKGFSLVELIVVVLIMAIIAVALAPQVMKWVGKSKESTDVSNYNSIVSHIQIAMTEDTTIKDAKIEINSSNTTITGTDATKLAKQLNEVSSYKFPASGTMSSNALVAKDSSKTYKIEIISGKIYRTAGPEGSAEPTPGP